MNKKVTNYQTSGSRDPIWTQVSSEPEDYLVSHGQRPGRSRRVRPQTSPPNQPLTRENVRGLGVLSTAILIAGEMAGSGVLALPRAVVDTGWIGLILVILFCGCAGYSGSRLGECWCIVEERFHQFREKTRNPYATVAHAACGPWVSRLVSCCIQITLFGAGTVYLLLASQIVQDLLSGVFPGLSFCSYFILLAAALCPAMWMGTPKDFWVVGLGALLTTALACICIFSKMLLDSSEAFHPLLPKDPIGPEVGIKKVHSFSKLFIAFGTILFSFGGASTFPTIQNDMKEKARFSTSIVIGFAVILCLYLPVVIGGFILYGDTVSSNILISLSHEEDSQGEWLVNGAYVLMGAHLILAFLIVVNPVCQEVEEIFSIPHHFSWRRCMIRTALVIGMLLVGETVPNFGKLLALVGGSTVTMLTFIFPPLFYMRLCDQEQHRQTHSALGPSEHAWPQRSIPLHIRVLLWEIILVGVVGGCASTYSAIHDIFGANSLTLPCYFL